LSRYTATTSADLHAMLDRYSDRETAQIRRILAIRHMS